MPYLQLKQSNQHKKNWICLCGRKNSNEDLRCAFCREPKPDKVKSAKKNRLGNVARKTEYNGRWYHSAMECEYAKELDFRKKAGDILEWKPQHKIDLIVGGVKICAYWIDFRVVNKDGSITMVECKGLETETWRMKWKLCMVLKEQIEPGAEWIIIK